MPRTAPCGGTGKENLNSNRDGPSMQNCFARTDWRLQLESPQTEHETGRGNVNSNRQPKSATVQSSEQLPRHLSIHPRLWCWHASVSAYDRPFRLPLSPTLTQFYHHAHQPTVETKFVLGSTNLGTFTFSRKQSIPTGSAPLPHPWLFGSSLRSLRPIRSISMHADDHNGIKESHWTTAMKMAAPSLTTMVTRPFEAANDSMHIATMIPLFPTSRMTTRSFGLTTGIPAQGK